MFSFDNHLLFRYLCSERALKGQNDSCLNENLDIEKNIKKQKKKEVSKEDADSKKSMKDNSPNMKQEL